MKKLRWAMDGDLWDMDMSTAQTLDVRAIARDEAIEAQADRFLPEVPFSLASPLLAVSLYSALLLCPSAMTGAVATASHSLLLQTDDEPQSFKHFRIRSLGKKSAALADIFGSLSFSACPAWKFFFDLSRLHVRLDFPSGSKVLEAIQALIPTTTLSSTADLEKNGNRGYANGGNPVHVFYGHVGFSIIVLRITSDLRGSAWLGFLGETRFSLESTIIHSICFT